MSKTWTELNTTIHTEQLDGNGWTATVTAYDGIIRASAQYKITPTAGLVDLVPPTVFPTVEAAKTGILRLVAQKLSAMLADVLSAE